MIWTDKKSVLNHGSRNIGAGELVPADVLASMGKDRVAFFVKAGRMSEDKTPKKPTERETLMVAAKEMGLQVAQNISNTKLKEKIAAEGTRLGLLRQAKELKLDVENDADAATLESMISEATAE